MILRRLDGLDYSDCDLDAAYVPPWFKPDDELTAAFGRTPWRSDYRFVCFGTANKPHLEVSWTARAAYMPPMSVAVRTLADRTCVAHPDDVECFVCGRPGRAPIADVAEVEAQYKEADKRAGRVDVRAFLGAA